MIDPATVNLLIGILLIFTLIGAITFGAAFLGTLAGHIIVKRSQRAEDTKSVLKTPAGLPGGLFGGGSSPVLVRWPDGEGGDDPDGKDKPATITSGQYL